MTVIFFTRGNVSKPFLGKLFRLLYRNISGYNKNSIYRPVNAILVVAGNITVEQAKQLSEKWFGDIPPGEKYDRHLPQEPLQAKARRQEIRADVPLDALYKAWHISSRLD